VRSVRGRHENRPFQPPKRSGSHKNLRVKTGRTCLTIPREKAVPETDATSCRETVFALSFCGDVQRIFSKIWENLSCRREARGIQKSGRGRGPRERATPMLIKSRRSRDRDRCTKRGPPSVPPSFSPFHSLDHSFGTGKPGATGSYAPLRGSRSPSGFLLPLPMYGHAARSGRGFRF